MDEEDRAGELGAERRQRNFLVSGTVLGLIALVALVATLLGVHWAAGFVGGFAVIAAGLLLRWRGEHRAAHDRADPS